jgi:WD40 repeat protein
MSDLVALGSQDGTWTLFDLSEGEELCRCETGERISEIKFHPDGLIMATGHGNGDLKLWDIRS